MKHINTILLAVLVLGGAVVTAPSHINAECVQFAETLSAKKYAKELGKSEMWVLQNFKINIWSKPTQYGRYPMIDSVVPGTHLEVLETRGTEYKVKTPKNKKIGWIGDVQIVRLHYQDNQTFKACEKPK